MLSLNWKLEEALKHPIPVNTLAPWDYNSFAMAILSQNHREVDIAELMLVCIVKPAYSKGIFQ